MALTTINEERARRFNDSLERSLQGGRLVQRFYEIFLASDPEVAVKFASTEFKRQQRMLTASMYLMMMASSDAAGLEGLAAIARRHGRGDLDIPPRMYKGWLRCLLQAVEECDPDWTPEVGEAWAHIMQRGVDFMITHR